MKAIKILMLLSILGTLNSFAGNIDYTKTANGVMLIASESNMGDLKKISSEYFRGYMSTYTANKNELVYNLELYSDGQTKQYALKIYLWSSKKKYQILPLQSKALIKLSDDSVLELNSIINDVDYEHGFSYTYYPINEKDLKKTFEGIKKVRIETLTSNDNSSTFIEYQDIEFNKDKMGKNLNKWYDAINEEYLKKANSLTLQSNSSKENKISDIKEGF